MQFLDFANTLDRIETESSRNTKTEILADFLKKLSNNEYRPVSYLLNGRVAPVFISLDYNYSKKLLMRSLLVFGKDEGYIKDLYKELGDVGLVVERLNDNDSVDLDILDVFERLRQIALFEGKGSQDKKIEEVSKLLMSVSSLSSKYIARMVIGKLRTGINHRTVLDAISWSINGDKSWRGILDRAYGLISDLGEVMDIAFNEGKYALESLEPQVGLPMASKLVEREKSVSKIYQRLGDCYIQPKYDGLRAQVHYSSKGIEILNQSKNNDNEQKLLTEVDDDKVAVYSRNMQSLTHMFPDVVQKMQETNLDSIIFDSEVIGYDPESKKYLPFQETIQRKRKYGVKDKANEIPIKVIIFDLLYLNGEDYTNKPLVNRLEKLKSIIPEDDMLMVSESFHAKTEQDISDKFEEYMNLNLEGLIAKTTDGIYEPGTRNYEWIKLKVRTEAGSVDSLDLVILGYYNGTGVRAKFGIGALLAGIYNKEKNLFLGMTKIGTGITDKGWVEIKKELDKHLINDKPDNVLLNKSLYPDVWVEPKIVSVVEFDEITKSQNYLTGNDKDEFGYSLRFPRLKQFGRDKNATDASTLKEVRKIYSLQYE